MGEVEIYRYMQFCIWNFFQTPSPLFFLIVSWFFNVAAELLFLERFFTCCKGRSFQGNCCQHKHEVRFRAFTEQNVEGFFQSHKAEERINLCTGKTLAVYLRDGWRHLLQSAWRQMQRWGKERELKLPKQWQFWCFQLAHITVKAWCVCVHACTHGGTAVEI